MRALSNPSEQVATTMTWDLATGIYTRHAYDADGKPVILERYPFRRVPFVKFHPNAFVMKSPPPGDPEHAVRIQSD